jgi:hypothetical protein
MKKILLALVAVLTFGLVNVTALSKKNSRNSDESAEMSQGKKRRSKQA